MLFAALNAMPGGTTHKGLSLLVAHGHMARHYGVYGFLPIRFVYGVWNVECRPMAQDVEAVRTKSSLTTRRVIFAERYFFCEFCGAPLL